MRVDREQQWPQTIRVARYGDSAGNVAWAEAEAAGIPLIDLEIRDADAPLSERGGIQSRAPRLRRSRTRLWDRSEFERRARKRPSTTMTDPTLITRDLLRRWPLPGIDVGGNKENRGRALVVGGSPEMPGAAILAGTAALRAGAGRLRIAAGQSIALLLGAAIPEGRVYGMPETAAGGLDPSCAERIIELANSAQAVLIGPGMLDEPSLAQLLKAIIPSLRRPLILDAAAFSVIHDDVRALHDLSSGALITPHAGEMAHIRGCDRDQVTRDCAAAAQAGADELRAVVVLKGHETVITAPGERIYVNRAGNLGLATAGSGDSLAGIIAGLAARGAGLLQAAVWGVYLHACAGDRLAQRVGGIGFLAREIAGEVPALIAEIEGGRSARHPGS